MTTAIYLRQSVDRADTELAVDRQRDKCRELCKRFGWTDLREYVDNDVSASKMRRKDSAYVRLLADTRAGLVRAVVVNDLDRLTRIPREIEDWIDLAEGPGIRLVTADGEVDAATENGRLFLRMKAAVARHEVERKAARQRAAAAQAAEQGRRIGGRRPFGYEPDGMTVRESEAGPLRDAYAAILAGVPLGAIARQFNAQGLYTAQLRRKDGGPSPWTAQTLRPTLLNPRYAGLRAHVTGEMRAKMDPRKARLAGIVGPAAWPALVSEETWRAAVELITNPARANPPRSGTALLTGLALCGIPGCGATVHGGRQRQGHKTYRCAAVLGHVNRQAAPVDEWVNAVVAARLRRSDAADLLVDDTRPDAEELRNRAAVLRVKIDGLASLFAEGVLDAAGVRRESERLRRDLGNVERQQADAGRADALGELLSASDPGAAYLAHDTDRQRVVINILMTVTLRPPGRGTRTFREDTVVIEWKGNNSASLLLDSNSEVKIER